MATYEPWNDTWTLDINDINDPFSRRLSRDRDPREVVRYLDDLVQEQAVEITTLKERIAQLDMRVHLLEEPIADIALEIPPPVTIQEAVAPEPEPEPEVQVEPDATSIRFSLLELD